MAHIDFYYDIASPYSYLAAARIGRLAGDLEVRWTPFLLGGVFNATGNQPPASVPARAPYLLADLHRWARRHDTPFKMSTHFPAHTLLAQRVLTAAAEEERATLSLALFRAHWVEDRPVSSAEDLRPLLGDRADALLSAAADPAVKDRLRSVTERAVERGAFGAPSFFVREELFWGNDRLEMAVELAVRM